MASTDGEPRVCLQVARFAPIQDTGYTAVFNQGNVEAMKVFIGRMLQAAGREVDDARLHVLAARALRVGAHEEAFEWLQSDVQASVLAAEEPRVPPPATATVCSANAHRPKTSRNAQTDGIVFSKRPALGAFRASRGS